MLRRTTQLLLAAAALSSFGCSSKPNNPPVNFDAGGTQEPGRSCNVDDECRDPDAGVGLRCDPIRRQCICTADQDCVDLHPGGDLIYCNNFTGLCVDTVAGCTSDKGCPTTSWCDDAVRACKARKGFCEECAVDRECTNDGDLCLEDTALKAHFCGKACALDTDCPANSACTDFSGKKQCWPKTGKNCKVFMGCTPDSKKSCTTTAECADAADQVCDPGTGLCVARLQICPFGQICDAHNHVCVDACQSDADCIAIASNLRCVGRACEPIGECAASTADPSGDKTCPASKVCSFNPGMTVGSCVPFCSADSECATGSICTKTPDGRLKCQAGCRVPADCPLDKTCVKTGTTPVGTCQGTAGVTCQTDQVCPACAKCDGNTFACVTRSASIDGYCRPCGTDDTKCGSGHCLAMKTGGFCGVPCPTTGCPRGFICNDICVNGSYDGFKCTGTLFAECIPVDLSCNNADASAKCKP